MDDLLAFIRALTRFSDDSWQALLPVLSERVFRRGMPLLETGTVCHSLFYIRAGYCRQSAVIDGVEKNTAFFFEGDMATELLSFGSGVPSAYSIYACEPVTAIAFDKTRLMEAAARTPEIETLGRTCLRRFSMKQAEFATLLQLHRPKDRLAYIEQHHPVLLQRVPATQLASFLGIARETLSRLRKQALTRKT